MNKDRIETMRTFWTSYGHEPDPVMVATMQLAKRKVEVRQDLSAFGVAPASQERLLEVALGDPAESVDAPVLAYVNDGRWVADCGECRGAEVVDDVSLLFMCGSCMNVAHEYQWRRVVMPDDGTRAAIEQALLMRPIRRTRNWRPDESLTDLLVENTEHGLMKPGDEVRIEAQPGQTATEVA